jgi:hypothetical protein
MSSSSAPGGLNVASIAKINPYVALIDKGFEFGEKGLKSYDDSTRRQETAKRGAPPKESVSMVKYIVIAVIIIAVMLIYFGVGRKWAEPPKYQSVFDNFTPDRMVFPERKPTDDMVSDSTRVFGIMPRKPIRVNV